MSDRLTDDEIRAMLAAATPGPWVQGSGWIGVTEPAFDCLVTYGVCDGDAGTDADACLMASAPTLAAEVLALRARVAELEADLMAAHGDPDDHGADCETCGHWTHAPIDGQCRACLESDLMAAYGDPDDMTNGGSDE